MENQDYKIFSEGKVTFTEGRNYKIPNNAEVTVLETRKTLIVKNSFKKANNLQRFKRISKDIYYDKVTKENKMYPKRDYKTEKSIKDNMRRLKILLDLNFYEGHNKIFITLTFKNNVQDIIMAKKYVTKFIRRLRGKYHLKYDFVYIYKFERQTNGCWHVHILLRDINNKKLYIQNSDIDNLWGLGYTYTETVKNNTNEYEENINDTNKNSSKGNNATKKITNYLIKTSQLFNVPNGVQIYGYSKNIELPKITRTTYEEAEEVIKDIGATLRSEKTINVSIDKMVINKHNRKIYTKKSSTKNNVFTEKCTNKSKMRNEL